MKQRTQLFLILALSFFYNYLSIAMENYQPTQAVALLVIPGQNEQGGQNTNVILPQFTYRLSRKKDSQAGWKYSVTTPTEWKHIDFGQEKCQERLARVFAFSEIQPSNTSVILHASSQGTATAINYTSKKPEKVKALILEAVMLSGNSAISHTIESTPLLLAEIPGKIPSIIRNVCRIVPYLPGNYYWVPYLAKIVFPGYAPAGEQPIFNTDKLQTNIPIIIMHHTKDPQLSVKDAEGLYAFLCTKNENVYLITSDTNDHGHVELLNGANTHEITAIQYILQHHKLLPDNTIQSPINLSKYKPDPKPEWLNHYNNLFTKEKRMWWFDKGIKVTLLSLIAYLIHRSGMAERFLSKVS